MINKFFTPKFNKKQHLIFFLILLAMIFYIFIPASKGLEPNKNILIIIWLAMAVFLFSFFKSTLKDLFSANLPDKYEDLKLKYGQPNQSFRVYMARLGDMRFKGFYAKLDIYNEIAIISIFGRAVCIDNFNFLNLNESFLTGRTLEVEFENTNIVCILSKNQYEYIKSIKEKNND